MKNLKRKKIEKPFSFLFFSLIITSTIFVLMIFLEFVTPEIFKIQLKSSWKNILMVLVLVHLGNSFVEYFFHRYILHTPIPGLKGFYYKHTAHHNLTHIRLRYDGKIKNEFPILKEYQNKSSFFPWYSLLLLVIIESPFLGIAQWLFPTAPIFLGGFLGIGFSMFLYETLHFLEHKPLEKWLPKLEGRWKQFFKIVYGFHLRHHADVLSNESISGFFGLPIPDWLFGTWKNPKTLFPDGKKIERIEFESPKPRWPICLIDNFFLLKLKKKIE